MTERRFQVARGGCPAAAHGPRRQTIALHERFFRPDAIEGRIVKPPGGRGKFFQPLIWDVSHMQQRRLKFLSAPWRPPSSPTAATLAVSQTCALNSGSAAIFSFAP
jgi:hypothetical protein